MRLKEQHDGYSSMGLWLKYQRPAASERIIKPRAKKDKNRWCGGRKGVEHQWHRYQKMHWNDEKWDYEDYYEIIECFSCYERLTKSHKKPEGELPLHLWIKQYDGSYAVQLSINGIPQPIKQLVYNKDQRWCWQCQRYH